MFEDKIKALGDQIFECVDSYCSLIHLVCSGDYSDCDECSFCRICNLENPFYALSGVILVEIEHYDEKVEV